MKKIDPDSVKNAASINKSAHHGSVGDGFGVVVVVGVSPGD